MNKKYCLASALVAVSLVLALVPSALYADGYRNLPEGAAAVGAFGGHRVFADDANAAIHNPANLVDLGQPMVQLNLMGGYGHNEFETMDGAVSDKTEDPIFVIPGLSAVLPLQNGKTAFGISAYVPYGRSVDWGDDGFFAQNGVPYSGSMTVMDVTPNLSMRLNKALSFSIGADIYNGEVEQRMFLVGPMAQALGLPSGAQSKLTADGAALGCNAALAWKMTENQRLAATIRSPFSIDYSGHNRIEHAGSLAVEGTIDYPTIVALAYGIELTDALRVEADVEWLQFSNYEELVIEDQFGNTTTSAQDLEDTWTAGIGAEWDFAPQWTLRSGFMHLQNPTPDETYSPLGPDEDQQVASLGLGYGTEHHAVDLAYAYGIFNGRDISGSANSPDGHYDYDVQVLSLSYGYKF
jgi:long-chain fatty acid transport protein